MGVKNGCGGQGGDGSLLEKCMLLNSGRLASILLDTGSLLEFAVSGGVCSAAFALLRRGSSETSTVVRRLPTFPGAEFTASPFRDSFHAKGLTTTLPYDASPRRSAYLVIS